jgi:hypothetical protein
LTFRSNQELRKPSQGDPSSPNRRRRSNRHSGFGGLQHRRVHQARRSHSSTPWRLGFLDPEMLQDSSTPSRRRRRHLSEIDRVDRSITDCIKLAEATLHSEESEAIAAAFNIQFDDFINQLGKVPSPNPVRKIKHDSTSLSALEEDLDRLLLGEGEATACRGPPSTTSRNMMTTPRPY